VHLHAAEPRKLGAALLRLPHVRELKITGPEEIEFVTEHPEVAYRELPGIVVSSGTPVRRVQTLDNTLEAVFIHMTEGGTRRL
jgi:hypothetical protein